jgi:hypothetical protein
MITELKLEEQMNANEQRAVDLTPSSSAARYTVISQNLGNSCPDIIAPVVEDGAQDRPTPGMRWVKHGPDVLLEWWCSHRGWVEVPFVPNAHASPPNAMAQTPPESTPTNPQP